MLICQNPITVYIEGEPLKMPCGHCKYCLQQKANKLSTQISLEYLTSPVVLYCTLTYAPDYLPEANVICTYADGYCHQQIKKLSNFAFSTQFDKDLLNSHKISRNDFNQQYQSGDVPVLCRSHVTNFIKRLRRYLQYHGLGQIRYYYCGEYGHKYGRPHYHALLFCQSETQSSILSKIIHTYWQYGTVNCQRARTSCASYLGSYLSSSYYSCFGTRTTAYPPFNSHSNRLGYRALHIQYINHLVRGINNQKDARSIFTSCRAPLTMPDGKLSSLPLWKTYTRTLLPKCVGFSKLDSSICRRLYTISSEVAKVFTNKRNLMSLWSDFYQGFCKSTFTLSQINLLDFLTSVYCTLCRNSSIIDAIHRGYITSSVLDKFSKWLDKVISVSNLYIHSSSLLHVSTYKLFEIISDFHQSSNYYSLVDQLQCFVNSQFGEAEMVYTYCNLPNYPVYLRHVVPQIVQNQRTLLETQISNAIFKKSHLF